MDDLTRQFTPAPAVFDTIPTPQFGIAGVLVLVAVTVIVRVGELVGDACLVEVGIVVPVAVDGMFGVMAGVRVAVGPAVGVNGTLARYCVEM
ncbi:MAG: hypothetical protein QM589_02360 [Thermomicrobiales bacterium]